MKKTGFLLLLMVTASLAMAQMSTVAAKPRRMRKRDRWYVNQYAVCAIPDANCGGQPFTAPDFSARSGFRIPNT